MELEVTRGRAARIWWAFMWRGLIAVICAGVVGGIVGAAIGFLSWLVVIRMILNRNYGEFRLALVLNSPVTAPPYLADSP